MADESNGPSEADLGPGELSTRGLPTARRGYEKKAVDALVASAIVRWSELHRRHSEILSEVAKMGGSENLARDLGAVGKEVGRILEAADDAAASMRDRAAEDAARIVGQAEQEAARILSDSEEQAAALRGSAWEEGTRLVEGAADAAAAMIANVKEEVLRLRADGEREAHRRLATTRKEADDMVRSARREADRQLLVARELALQIVERVGAEGRPVELDEVMDQIDRIRAARSIEDVSAVPAEPAPTGRTMPAVGVPGDLSESLASEVERIRHLAGPDSEGEGTESPRRRDVLPEIGSLFEALRTTSEQEVTSPEESGNAIAVRDRRLLVLHNAAGRDVKRRIVELQERIIDDVGSAETPTTEAVAADLTALLEPLVTRAAGVGATVARDAAGVERRPQFGPRVDALVANMAGDLASRLRSAWSSAEGSDDAAAALRRVFRRWRTDEADRWVRTVLAAAYHDALLASLAAGGFDRVRGVPSAAAGCKDCLGASGSVWDPAEVPDGLGVPPVDIDCRCGIEVVATDR